MTSEMQDAGRKREIRGDSGKCPGSLGRAASEEDVMKKYLVVAACLIIIISSARPAAGQEPGATPGRTAAAPDRLFSQVVLRLRDGRFVTGLLLGFEDDAIVLRVGKDDVKTSRADLAQVTVERDVKAAGCLLNGMLLGFLAGNLAFSHGRGNPTGYVEYGSTLGALLSNGIYLGVGGAVSYLVSLIGDRKHILFAFPDLAPERNAEWDRLKKYALAADTGGDARWRLSVQSADVFPRVSSRYQSVIQAAGYETYSEYGGSSTSLNINVLRRVGLSYAPSRHFEIGAAVVLLGERSSLGLIDKSWDNVIWTYGEIEQSLSGTAYYLTGSWRIVDSKAAGGVGWKIGGGLGAAHVRLGLSGSVESYDSQSYYSSAIEYSTIVSKTVAGGLAFTEFDCRLFGGISLGVMADYAVTLPVSIPAVPAAGIPAQKLSMGNGSLGIGITWIF
jgi:hypothetical protein